jgi:hypothetical protein
MNRTPSACVGLASLRNEFISSLRPLRLCEKVFPNRHRPSQDRRLEHAFSQSPPRPQRASLGSSSWPPSRETLSRAAARGRFECSRTSASQVSVPPVIPRVFARKLSHARANMFAQRPVPPELPLTPKGNRPARAARSGSSSRPLPRFAKPEVALLAYGKLGARRNRFVADRIYRARNHGTADVPQPAQGGLCGDGL